MQHITEMTMNSTRNGKPTPTLESTTAAVRNSGVLEPGGVCGGGREIKVKLRGYSIVVLKHYEQ